MWGRRVCQWSDCLPRSSHTPPVSVPPQPRESSLPRLPVSAPPTGLDECLFFISLVSDFLAVRFSVSSGCARRRSVSTYAAILVLYCLDFQNPITKPLLNDPSRKVLRFYSHWFHPNFFNCFQDSVEWANKLPNTDQFCFFQSVVRHRSLFL